MNVKRSLVVRLSKQESGSLYYLRCSSYISNKSCTYHSIRLDYVQNIVINKLNEILQTFNEEEKLAKFIINKLSNNKNINKSFKEYKKRLSKLEIEIDSLYNDKLNNLIFEEDFKRIYDKKSKEKEYLLKKIKIIEESEKTNITYDMIKNIIDKIKNNTKINREILNSLVDKIEIDNSKNIYIYFKFRGEN